MAKCLWSDQPRTLLCFRQIYAVKGLLEMSLEMSLEMRLG